MRLYRATYREGKGGGHTYLATYLRHLGTLRRTVNSAASQRPRFRRGKSCPAAALLGYHRRKEKGISKDKTRVDKKRDMLVAIVGGGGRRSQLCIWDAWYHIQSVAAAGLLRCLTWFGYNYEVQYIPRYVVGVYTETSAAWRPPNIPLWTER